MSSTNTYQTNNQTNKQRNDTLVPVFFALLIIYSPLSDIILMLIKHILLNCRKFEQKLQNIPKSERPAVVMNAVTLRASLSGTFLQCLEFGVQPKRHCRRSSRRSRKSECRRSDESRHKRRVPMTSHRSACLRNGRGRHCHPAARTRHICFVTPYLFRLTILICFVAPYMYVFRYLRRWAP